MSKFVFFCWHDFRIHTNTYVSTKLEPTNGIYFLSHILIKSSFVCFHFLNSGFCMDREVHTNIGRHQITMYLSIYCFISAKQGLGKWTIQGRILAHFVKAPDSLRLSFSRLGFSLDPS